MSDEITTHDMQALVNDILDKQEKLMRTVCVDYHVKSEHIIAHAAASALATAAMAGALSNGNRELFQLMIAKAVSAFMVSIGKADDIFHGVDPKLDGDRKVH